MAEPDAVESTCGCGQEKDILTMLEEYSEQTGLSKSTICWRALNGHDKWYVFESRRRNKLRKSEEALRKYMRENPVKNSGSDQCQNT